MRRLCFLLEAPWEIVIFVFLISCLFYLFMLLFFFIFLIYSPHVYFRLRWFILFSFCFILFLQFIEGICTKVTVLSVYLSMFLSVCLSFSSIKLFTVAFADDLSLESECQVFMGLQCSSKYSGHSQQSVSVDGLDFSSNFQFFMSLFQAFEGRSKRTKYNCYC